MGLRFAGFLALLACDAAKPLDCRTAGHICTVAGTGSAQFDGDGRPAGQTSFYLPLDLAFDREGRLVVLDFNNLRLRRVEPHGVVSTIAGTGFEGEVADGELATRVSLHHAYSIAYDRDFNLFVAGNHSPVVLRLDRSGRVAIMAGSPEFEGDAGDGGPARRARLHYPSGVAVTTDGFVVADTGNHRLRRVRADGIIEAFAGTGERGFSGDGGPAVKARLAGPSRVHVRSNGAILFVDTANHAVREVSAEGLIRTLAGTGAEGSDGVPGLAELSQLRSPRAAVVGPDGLLYIADTGNHRVLRLRDGRLEVLAGTGLRGHAGDGGPAAEAALNQPSGLAFSGSGDLYLADAGNHSVRRVAGVVGR